jgi:hypothetical protein
LLFFFLLQDDEDIGIVYQDTETEAALLVNHDADDDAVMLVQY